MREKVIAGNWKMYTSPEQGAQLAKDLIAETEGMSWAGKRAILIPPFTHIMTIASILKDQDNIYTGAQNCHYEKEGAFTGEISARMLAEAGASYVTIGHSERRQYFHEDNAFLAKKVNSVLEESLTPIYCCGETLEEREANRYFDVVGSQVTEGLFHLSAEQIKNVIVAYEPVWAIGTGKTASPEQAQEIHAHIRSLFATKYGKDIADGIIILYGGSVKPNNAAELFGQADIDGGLVGGASLKAADFAAIIKAA